MSITMIIPPEQVEAFIAKVGSAATVSEWNSPDNKWGYVKVTFAVGRVVELRERNGYNDSDFYATYMRDDGSFDRIEYATTRGWTYANGAMVDASNEVQEAYVIQNKAIAEANRKYAEAQREAALEDAAKSCNITREQLNRLYAAYPDKDMQKRLVKLLSSNLRSEFRISLANRVREWLNNPNPTHNTPLSHKQSQYV